jgi:hypothetical protein
MIARAGTGRALAAPRPPSLAVPLLLRNKEVAERRSELKRREMTQVHRPALSQYWWATHLRQLRSTLRQRGKRQMTIDHLKNSWRATTEIEIIAAEDDEATKAASEFRGCAFIGDEMLEVGA